MISEEDGYTITELLIALAIISIILGIVGSTFIFISQQMNKWDGNIGFYNNYQVVSERVYDDMLGAEQFSVSDTSFHMTGINQISKNYSWTSGVIKLNQKAMVVSGVDSLFITWDEVETPVNFYSWNLNQTNDQKKLTVRFQIHLRKPVVWEPLNRRGQ